MSSFQLTHIFGLNGKVKGNLIYLEENVVAYPCGHLVVIFNTETKTQRFIFGADGSEKITAMACSPNRRILAIAEKNLNERAIVTLHDVSLMKKRKSLSSADIQSREFIHIAFSPDNRFLLTLSGAPDWTLSVWNWEKGKHVVSLKVSNTQGSKVNQADFNPTDPSVIGVSGDGILKFFKLQDGAFKQQSTSLKRDLQRYLCHSWLPNDRFVVATDTGELLLFENYEMRALLSVNPEPTTLGKELKPSPNGDMIDILTITAYNKGFVCGGAENMLRVFEKADDPQEVYKHTKTFTVEGKSSKIITLALSPSEDNLACALSNHQMYVLGLSNTDILKVEEMSFELLTTSVHSPGSLSGEKPGNDRNEMITGLDACIRKPYVATCGADRSIRIWNYVEKTAELTKLFMESLHSIAFHPSGLHILVGFESKLCLMNLLMDDIRVYKEIPIQTCKECRFSNGGMYFAAVNANTVQVFKTYSFECLLTLRGHSGRVRSISWTKDDRSIITAGYDGSLFQWSVKDGQVEAEHKLSSNVQYISAIPANLECTSVFSATSEKLLKEIELSTGKVKSEVEAYPQGGMFGEITLSNSYKSFFAALHRPEMPGLLLALKLPLTDNSDNFENVDKISVHSRSATRLCISSDDQFLFSAGDDGSLAIFEVKDPGATTSKKREKEPPLPFAEEILVTKSDLEQKTTLMEELKRKVEELTLHNEYQLRLKDMNYNEKIKEVTEKYTEELELDKAKYHSLEEEKNEMIMMYKEKFVALKQKQAKELTEVSKMHQQKINAEIARYEELVQERERRAHEWEEQNRMLVETHEKFVNELTADYEKQLDVESKERNKLENEKVVLIRDFEHVKEQIEDDADYEIDELKKKYEAKLIVEREATLRLKGENGIMKKKYASLQSETEEKRDKLKGLTDREADLYERIKVLEKDIHGHNKEIKERKDTIADKEKRIYDLKKKNQELEKFKFVLDYKIKELKRQIEPRENEIADMKQQIKEMDLELEQYHKSNSALDLMIGELRLKIEGMQKELDGQKEELEFGESFANQYCTNLHQVMQKIDNYNNLKSAVVALYKAYIPLSTEGKSKIQGINKTGSNVIENNDSQRETNRQREYLEKTVQGLKRKLAKDMKIHKAERLRLMRESVELTNEINNLRREYRAIQVSYKRPSKTKMKNLSMDVSKSQNPESKDVDIEADPQREVQLQVQQIRNLTEQINRLEHALGLR